MMQDSYANFRCAGDSAPNTERCLTASYSPGTQSPPIYQEALAQSRQTGEFFLRFCAAFGFSGEKIQRLKFLKAETPTVGTVKLEDVFAAEVECPGLSKMLTQVSFVLAQKDGSLMRPGWST